MEETKLILYQVIGSGEFKSITVNNLLEAENIAFVTRGVVVKIIKP